MRPGIKQRLFCDICDMFDQHDTDDCPTQSSGALDDQGTQYHGNRNEDRAYCDICEGMEILAYMLSSIGLIVVKLWFCYSLCMVEVFLVSFITIHRGQSGILDKEAILETWQGFFYPSFVNHSLSVCGFLMV